MHLDKRQVASADEPFFDAHQPYSTTPPLSTRSMSANEVDPQIDAFTASVRAHPAVMRVRDSLIAAGLADTIIVMPQATHTAQAAAEALGCNVGEIAKSIIFRAESGHAVLVITSGKNRVDEEKVAALLGEKIGKADADFVRAATGFVIGGVAPMAHVEASTILLDEDLLQYTAIYPAAGHPNTMFRISPAELLRVTGARVSDIRAQPKSAE
jgi:prolyl-tRNA editing enzyme YbaK/EbsC (Cys-tRNA(Pro) deacylase)